VDALDVTAMVVVVAAAAWVLWAAGQYDSGARQPAEVGAEARETVGGKVGEVARETVGGVARETVGETVGGVAREMVGETVGGKAAAADEPAPEPHPVSHGLPRHSRQ
jgi:hypothetical protein